MLSRGSKENTSHLEQQKRWKKLVSNALETQKKFTNIKLESLERQDVQGVLEVVKAHQTSLKRVEVCNGFHTCQSLMDIFFAMTNLTTISMHNCNYFRGFEDVNVVPLINLQHVIINKCTLEILKLFTASQITSLKIYNIRSNEGKFLKDFLSTQTKLETLAINAMISFFNSDFAPIGESTLKLKNFTVSGFIFTTQEAVLIKFFETHGKFLQNILIELVLSSVNQPTKQSVYKYVLMNIASLRKLTINAERFPTKLEFYEGCPSTGSVTELTIVRNFKTDSRCLNVLGLLNNLQSLTMGLVTENIVKFIEIKYKKLKYLKITMLPTTHDPLCVKFPLLKEFHVDNIGSDMNWILFLKNNPSIEAFSIKNIALQQIKATTVKTLTHASSMKRIKLQGSREAMRKFFHLTKEKGWNRLETLELIETNKEDDSTINFYFSLPKDNGLWNSKCPL